MSSKLYMRVFQLIIGIILLSFAAGCGALTPEFTYQGRLTDASGTPLHGDYTITYKLFDASTGGTEIYTETNTVTVTDGLFESVIGPNSALGSLDPQDLTQPLYIQLTISNGTVTETLSPRQRLYGAPYAFTLMPGSVISGDLDTTLFGTSNVKSVLTVQNPYDGDVSNPALPALRVIGETGIELSNPTSVSGPGIITSNPASSISDIEIITQDDVIIQLDKDGSGPGEFRVKGDTTSDYCYFTDTGNSYCTGTKSATLQLDGEQRLMYTMESTEVWFEDFGSGKLVNGVTEITIDPLFAQAIDTADYHVFLTPLGDSNGLFIATKGTSSFTVQESSGGTSNISFDYRIIGKRLGYENERMELDTSALLDEEESK